MLIIITVCFINNGNIAETLSLNIIPYFVLSNGCFVTASEFTNNTDKIIFTGIYNRKDILISKLSYLIISSIISLILAISSLYITSFFIDISRLNSTFIMSALKVTLLYTFTVGSFMILVSIISRSSIFTGIITYILFFDLTFTILGSIVGGTKDKLILNLIQFNPLYLSELGFTVFHYNLNQSISMFISGIFFFALACFILDRIDI
ncbi:ABC-2 type transport system permease protein [Paeniclostridium ghonii]|uniref:ABC-2 type transport system permease protein n=2 Tax=Paraclostridium ghonii TaxID=29358 RepID=A0ABU0MZE3_9FIRM|nr:ABC-2 type transport system permease protein [Paeniclostridium ghonii]